MNWAYGVTTVPSRREDLLPRTLASLKAAGFDKPRLFVDGSKDVEGYEDEFEVPVSCRFPALRTSANWVMSLHELYLRSPTADRFAIFQDDVLCVSNLKSFLEESPCPSWAYLNLYTYDSNLLQGTDGWYVPPRKGKGALALVFSRRVVQLLLTSRHLVERTKPTGIDGGIVTALEKADVYELVHNPSLVQHIGAVSSIGHATRVPCSTFPGERRIT